MIIITEVSFIMPQIYTQMGSLLYAKLCDLQMRRNQCCWMEKETEFKDELIVVTLC